LPSQFVLTLKMLVLSVNVSYIYTYCNSYFIDYVSALSASSQHASAFIVVHAFKMLHNNNNYYPYYLPRNIIIIIIINQFNVMIYYWIPFHAL